MRAYLWTMVVIGAIDVALSLFVPREFLDKPVSDTGHRVGLAIKIGLLAWAIALLAACGGGDATDDERDAGIGPVDCKLHPELCQ